MGMPQGIQAVVSSYIGEKIRTFAINFANISFREISMLTPDRKFVIALIYHDLPNVSISVDWAVFEPYEDVGNDLREGIHVSWMDAISFGIVTYPLWLFEHNLVCSSQQSLL